MFPYSVGLVIYLIRLFSLTDRTCYLLPTGRRPLLLRTVGGAFGFGEIGFCGTERLSASGFGFLGGILIGMIEILAQDVSITLFRQRFGHPKLIAHSLSITIPPRLNVPFLLINSSLVLNYFDQPTETASQHFVWTV